MVHLVTICWNFLSFIELVKSFRLPIEVSIRFSALQYRRKLHMSYLGKVKGITRTAKSDHDQRATGDEKLPCPDKQAISNLQRIIYFAFLWWFKGINGKILLNKRISKYIHLLIASITFIFGSLKNLIMAVQ